MSPTLAPEVLARLSEWATAEFALRFPPDRWNELARGVASAALELGLPDLTGWVESLVTRPPRAEEARAIANHLTISETYFFRHPETFTTLERRILPGRIAARRERSQMLRIWSAGCASGEEPYSVAILLRQRFPDLRPERVAISGTDLNDRVLARAEAAVYSEWSFRDVPPAVKAGWFRRTAKGRYEVLPEIRQMVHFRPLNLASEHYPAEFGPGGDFDVILCRNVLMYFSAEWQERILRRFAAALVSGGWLIVGPCDVTVAQAAEMELEGASPGIYQKLESGRRRAERSAVAHDDGMHPPVWTPGIVPAETRPPVDLAPPMLPLEPPPAVADEATVEVPLVRSASEAALAHADRGELERALAACDEALAADKTNPQIHYLRACILQEQNRPEEAAEALRRVLFLEPGSAMAEFALGCLAQRGGRGEQARRHFRAVLSLLGDANRGDTVPGSDGLTVARLRAVVEKNLAGDDQ